jgi:holdfast attachment protein HfaA
MAATPQNHRIAILASAALMAAAAAGPAFAQTMSASSASYNSGYGRTPDEENQPINPSLRDPNGNLLVINGIITNSSNQGLFSGGVASSSSGASSSGSGAFASGATAIGNNLSVVTEGNDNTVIIDSRQTNNGTVTANSSTSGGVGNGN